MYTRRVTFLAAIVVMLLACCRSADAQEAPRNIDKLELYKRVRQCTVKVSARIGEKVGKQGTGVCFMRAGGGTHGEYAVVVTNSHVVSEYNERTQRYELAPTIKVKPWQKGKETWLEAQVMFHHLSDKLWFDLAFLIVKDPDGLISKAAVATQRDHKVGSTVYACGNPQDEEFLVDDGEIVDFKWPVKNSGQLLAHNALIERGSSGGGLFNSRGELIGINTWLYELRTGIAQDAQWFFEWFRFGSASVGSRAGDWQNIVVSHEEHGYVDMELHKGQSLYMAALGTWTYNKTDGATNAGGVSGYENRRVSKEHNYASALVRVGESMFAIGNGMWGTDGAVVAPPDFRVSERISTTGKVSYRMNDTDISDNGGYLTLIYFVMGNPVWYIGVDTAAPWKDDRERWNLYTTDEKGNRKEIGARVINVHDFSDCAHAGLKKGDIIISVTGYAGAGEKTYVTESTLNSVIQDLREGKAKGWRIMLTYRREGKDHEVLLGLDGK